MTQQRKEKHSGHSKEERKSNGHLQSPYGCHAVPDIAKSLHPKLNSLPNEPLKKGEQYFLDLAGNIQKVYIFYNQKKKKKKKHNLKKTSLGIFKSTKPQ